MTTPDEMRNNIRALVLAEGAAVAALYNSDVQVQATNDDLGVNVDEVVQG